MAIPTAAVQVARPRDPSDIRPMGIDFANQLEAGEAIASFTVVRSTDAIAAGLEILTGGDRDPELINDDTAISLWPAIEAGEVNNARFASPNGIVLDFEVTVVTNTTPTETIQKTVTVQWVQQ